MSNSVQITLITLNSAYYFDGNSYIRIPDNDSLDFWPNQDFTIHFWIKTNNCVTNENQGSRFNQQMGQ